MTVNNITPRITAAANTTPDVPDGVAVTVQHPNGGVSEVLVYLTGDRLEVSVSPSHANPFTITNDGDDIDFSLGTWTTQDDPT